MFTKQKVKNFRSDFQNAVAELEGQYGVNINLGTITWDSKSVSVKMKAIVGEKFIAPTKDEFNIGDRVLINHKKISNRDQFIIVKINNKNVKVEQTNVPEGRIGDVFSVHPSLLQKL